MNKRSLIITGIVCLCAMFIALGTLVIIMNPMSFVYGFFGALPVCLVVIVVMVAKGEV